MHATVPQGIENHTKLLCQKNGSYVMKMRKASTLFDKRDQIIRFKNKCIQNEAQNQQATSDRPLTKI